MRMTYVAALLTALATSCTVLHRGMVTGVPSPPAEPQEVVDVAFGFSQTIYLFGIGGWGHDAMVASARRNLHEHYVLGPGQHLQNLTYDVNFFVVGPYIRRRVILSAEVVQRDSAAPTTTYSEAYRRKTKSVQSYRYDSTAVGPAEVLIFQFEGQQDRTAQVVEANKRNVRVCFYENGRPRVRFFSNDQVFYTQRAPMGIARGAGIAVGDSVYANTNSPLRDTNVIKDNMRPVPQAGRSLVPQFGRSLVLGLGYEKALLRMRTTYGSQVVTVPYAQLEALTSEK